MSEPLYRIDLSPTYGKTPETQRPIYKQADVDEWIADGVLVPVERCEHGNIDGHWYIGYGTQTITDGIDGPEVARIEHHPGEYWCPGAGIGGSE